MTTPEPPFEGVGVALVTLFDDAGAVDAPATADLAARLVDTGVRAVLVCGTTGEADTLTEPERGALLEAVRARVGERAVVLAGTGAPSRLQAAALTRQARDGGADAAVVRSPPGVADPRAYYRHVVDAAGALPVLAYHFPAVAPPGVPVDALADLPVAGLKDSSGDAKRLLRTLARVAYPVYPGSASVVTMAGAVGCPGVILAIANSEPEGCRAAFAGDGHVQRELAAASEAASGGLGALKQLVAERFGVSARTRLG